MLPRFQFSISNALLCMLVVGVSLGWWIDRNRTAREAQRLRHEYSVGQPNYFRRLAAIEQLGALGTVDSIPALLYALGDPDFRCCDAASKSLSSITGKSFRPKSMLDPTLAYDMHTDDEKEKLRQLFQTERVAWTNFLQLSHPDVNPEFEPYKKVAEHVDAPVSFWAPTE